MTDPELDALIDASEPLLGFTLDPAWRPAIRAHLAISIRHALAVAAFDLPDELDPAPVFTA